MVVGVSARRRRRWTGRSGGRRGGSGGYGHRHRMAGVATTTTGLGAQGVVQCSPIAGLDVLPGAVVREGRLVLQRRSSCLRGRWIRSCRLGQRRQGQAKRHDGRQPANEVVHRSKPCDSSARHRRSRKQSRSSAMTRTNEPSQTSLGGLDGSDGSGRTLLPIRDEARRRSRQVGELDAGQRHRFRQAGRFAQQRGQ